jgi:hypothetical protein
MLRKSCFCLVFFLFVLSGVTPCAGNIFWSEENLINRASDDGSSAQTIVTMSANSRVDGIAFDVPNGHLYYGVGYDNGYGPECGLYRANLDGSNPVLLVHDYVSDVELDLVNREVYWCYGLPIPVTPVLIRRANLDGTNVETLATFGPYDGFSGLALDPGAGNLFYAGWDYWEGTPYVARANLDGSNPVRLVSLRHWEPSHDLEIDLTAGKLYVVQCGNNYPTRRVSRLNLDGSNFETFLEMGGVGLKPGIALDTEKGHLYYADGLEDGTATCIRRLNTDGTGDQFLLATGTCARYMEYAVPEPSSLALCIGAAIAGFYLWSRRRGQV